MQMNTPLNPQVGIDPLRLNDILATGTSRNIRRALSWIKEVLDADKSLLSDTANDVIKRLQRAVQRSLYRVHAERTLKWENGRLLATNHRLYQDKLTNEHLTYVEVNKEITRFQLEQLCARAKQGGYQFLGVKAGNNTTTAVFCKGPSYEAAMVYAMGAPIGLRIVKSKLLKDLQNAVQLLCRVGSLPVIPGKISWPTAINDDPRYDGLVARVSSETMRQIKTHWYGLPMSTKWIQVTILDRLNGHATKGTIVECEPHQEPEVYRASWKFGCLTGELEASNMTICNADSLYRPAPCLNIQALVYNYTPDESKQLIEQLFVPSIKKMTGFEHFAQAHGVEKLMALGYGIDLERARYFHQKLVYDKATKANVIGIRTKVAPNPELEAFEIKVPRKSEDTWAIGDIVDVTRDPSLPVGNSTQRYTVVGYTQGNYCEISSEPWMTVQGGDYDGDDCSVTSDTVNILPGKVYDKTPVSLLTEKKKSVRTGADIWSNRVKQAMYVIEGNIGKWDLMARRAYEMGKLDYTMKLQLSRAVQAEVDRKKHEVPRVDVPAIMGMEESDFAINYIRGGEWDNPIIKGTVYEQIATTAKEVAQTWLPIYGINQLMIEIPQCDNAVLARCRKLTDFYQDCFRTITRKAQENKTLKPGDVKFLTQQEMERLALRMKLRLEKAKKAGKWAVLAMTMAKYANPTLVCKVLTLEECRIVYTKAMVKLTK